MTRRRAIEILRYSSQMLGQAIDRAIEALEIVKGRRCQPFRKGK